MLIPNITILIQFLIFVSLWLILTRILFRPMLDYINRRETETEGRLKDARSTMEKYQAMVADYDSRMSAARFEISALAAKDRARTKDSARVLLESAKKASAAEVEKVKSRISAELKTVAAKAEGDGVEVGREIAEQILGRKI
jgi:F-type H+-transporting ATPase subunit b